MARRSRWAPLFVPVLIGLVAVGALATGAAVWGGDRFDSWLQGWLNAGGPAAPTTEYTGPQIGPAPVGTAPRAMGVKVLETRPHDPAAFTQGLLWHDGALLESTGLNGESTLRRVDAKTGDVLQKVDVPADIFAEGLARVDDRLIQLSWQNKRAFVYDRATFARKGELTYDTEGWGLCYDGARLVMSDGTSTLYFRDPTTFAITGQVTVTSEGRPRDMLNELECVGNRVYANVWQTDTLVRIDPGSGAIDEVIDAAGLLTPEERSQTDVLNGIAWDPSAAVFYITGKLWPKLFVVRFEEG